EPSCDSSQTITIRHRGSAQRDAACAGSSRSKSRTRARLICLENPPAEILYHTALHHVVHAVRFAPSDPEEEMGRERAASIHAIQIVRKAVGRDVASRSGLDALDQIEIPDVA